MYKGVIFMSSKTKVDTGSSNRSELEQALYEAKHHQYAGEYDSLEDFRKDLYSSKK